MGNIIRSRGAAAEKKKAIQNKSEGTIDEKELDSYEKLYGVTKFPQNKRQFSTLKWQQPLSDPEIPKADKTHRPRPVSQNQQSLRNLSHQSQKNRSQSHLSQSNRSQSHRSQSSLSRKPQGNSENSSDKSPKYEQCQSSSTTPTTAQDYIKTIVKKFDKAGGGALSQDEKEKLRVAILRSQETGPGSSRATKSSSDRGDTLEEPLSTSFNWSLKEANKKPTSLLLAGDFPRPGSHHRNIKALMAHTKRSRSKTNLKKQKQPVVQPALQLGSYYDNPYFSPDNDTSPPRNRKRVQRMGPPRIVEPYNARLRFAAPPVYISSTAGCPAKCRNNPVERLKNLDIVEELTYYPDGTENGSGEAYDYYNVCNDCGCMEFAKDGPDGIGSGKPVTYSRKQRFNFKNPYEENDNDGPPFKWPYNIPPGTYRTSSFDEIPVGKNPYRVPLESQFNREGPEKIAYREPSESHFNREDPRENSYGAPFESQFPEEPSNDQDSGSSGPAIQIKSSHNCLEKLNEILPSVSGIYYYDAATHEFRSENVSPPPFNNRSYANTQRPIAVPSQQGNELVPCESSLKVLSSRTSRLVPGTSTTTGSRREYVDNESTARIIIEEPCQGENNTTVYAAAVPVPVITPCCPVYGQPQYPYKDKKRSKKKKKDKKKSKRKKSSSSSSPSISCSELSPTASTFPAKTSTTRTPSTFMRTPKSVGKKSVQSTPGPILTKNPTDLLSYQLSSKVQDECYNLAKEILLAKLRTQLEQTCEVGTGRISPETVSQKANYDSQPKLHRRKDKTTAGTPVRSTALIPIAEVDETSSEQFQDHFESNVSNAPLTEIRSKASVIQSGTTSETFVPNLPYKNEVPSSQPVSDGKSEGILSSSVLKTLVSANPKTVKSVSNVSITETIADKTIPTKSSRHHSKKTKPHPTSTILASNDLTGMSTASTFPADERRVSNESARMSTASTFPADERRGSNESARMSTASTFPADERRASNIPTKTSAASSHPATKSSRHSSKKTKPHPTSTILASNDVTRMSTASTFPTDERRASNASTRMSTASTVPGDENLASNIPTKTSAASSHPASKSSRHSSKKTKQNPTSTILASNDLTRMSTASTFPADERRVSNESARMSTASIFPANERRGSNESARMSTASTFPADERRGSNESARMSTASTLPADERRGSNESARMSTASSFQASENFPTRVKAVSDLQTKRNANRISELNHESDALTPFHSQVYTIGGENPTSYSSNDLKILGENEPASIRTIAPRRNRLDLNSQDDFDEAGKGEEDVFESYISDIPFTEPKYFK